MPVITFIICTHTKSPLISAYFNLHLLQRMPGNGLLPLENPLRIYYSILEHAILDRSGSKSLKVTCSLSSTVNGTGNIKL